MALLAVPDGKYNPMFPQTVSAALVIALPDKTANRPAALALPAAPRLSGDGGTGKVAVGVAVNTVVFAAVGVEVAVAVPLTEVGVFEPHPVIKAIGSITVKIKKPKKNFFTCVS